MSKHHTEPPALCANCGTETPFHLLDAKPERLAGPNHSLAELDDAMWDGEDFDRLECEACYGPGWVAAKP